VNDQTTRPRRSWFWIAILSLSINLILLAIYLAIPDESGPSERYLFGKKAARDKVAVIKVEGLLAEGLTNHALAQIETAYQDDTVKAVVLHVNSPGGTISASEELHRELTRLREGKHPRLGDKSPRPMFAHFGSIAASGGYYIAMPAEQIYAEKGTITGSIGVYASFPNAVELANKVGFHMNLIKAGAIKASGSPFHEMTPAERFPWQTMVDTAYQQFLEVIQSGRPNLTIAKLKNEIVLKAKIPLFDHKGNTSSDAQAKEVDVQRVRADGGTYTAIQAKEFGLIDEIGQIEDTANAVAKVAKLNDYQVIGYVRPVSYLDLIGLKAKSSRKLDPTWALSPRMWMLSSGADMAPIGLVLGSWME
jgi:protease IV